jgi:uncharacterized membrane protein
MRRFESIAAALLLSACGGSGAPPPPEAEPVADTSAAAAPAGPAGAISPQPKAGAARWDLQASGEGTALVFLSASGGAAIRLYCPAARPQLLVNVPAFRPVGSEERLSFGSGGAATALVADTRGDKQRGGVSGTAAVPADLATLIAGPVSASYGAQVSGPHPAPPQQLAQSFVAACRTEAKAEQRPGDSPCQVQGGKRLSVQPLRAVGTEPFWGAAVQGRCVTYSHAEDQKGIRVWTRYAPAAGGGTWTGTNGGKPFVLTIRPAPGCSDGMSDRRYPLAAELLVGGERLQGCAAPS